MTKISNILTEGGLVAWNSETYSSFEDAVNSCAVYCVPIYLLPYSFSDTIDHMHSTLSSCIGLSPNVIQIGFSDNVIFIPWEFYYNNAELIKDIEETDKIFEVLKEAYGE